MYFFGASGNWLRASLPPAPRGLTLSQARRPAETKACTELLLGWLPSGEFKMSTLSLTVSKIT